MIQTLTNEIKQRQHALLVATDPSVLHDRLFRSLSYISIESGESLTAKRLLEEIFLQCKLPFPVHLRAQQEIIDTLATRLNSQQQAPILCIVRHAHTLSFSALAALSYLAATQEKTVINIQLLLIGQPALLKRAQQLQFKEVVSVKRTASTPEVVAKRTECLPSFSADPMRTRPFTVPSR